MTTISIPQGDRRAWAGAGLPPHAEKRKKDPYKHDSTASAGLIHKELDRLCMGGAVGQVRDDGRDMGEARGPVAKMCGVLYMSGRKSCLMWLSVPLCPGLVPLLSCTTFVIINHVFTLNIVFYIYEKFKKRICRTAGQRKWVNFSKMGYPWESYRKTLSCCPAVLFFIAFAHGHLKRARR